MGTHLTTEGGKGLLRPFSSVSLLDHYLLACIPSDRKNQKKDKERWRSFPQASNDTEGLRFAELEA